FSALTTELRLRGVTTLFTVELQSLFGAEIALPVPDLSDSTDNIVFLRQMELRSHLYRLVSVLKMRESNASPTIREFRITERGIEVSPSLESAEDILSNVRPASFPRAERPATATAAMLNDGIEERA